MHTYSVRGRFDDLVANEYAQVLPRARLARIQDTKANRSGPCVSPTWCYVGAPQAVRSRHVQACATDSPWVFCRLFYECLGRFKNRNKSWGFKRENGDGGGGVRCTVRLSVDARALFYRAVEIGCILKGCAEEQPGGAGGERYRR